MMNSFKTGPGPSRIFFEAGRTSCPPGGGGREGALKHRVIFFDFLGASENLTTQSTGPVITILVMSNPLP